MATRKHIEPIASEHQEQCAVIDWATMMAGQYPELELLFAIPNGGHRHPATAARLKAEGVKAGIPDLFLPVPRRCTNYEKTSVINGINVMGLSETIYNGMYIELKRRKGGRTTDVQRWWHSRLQQQGYRVEVCKGSQEAIAVLSDYLGIKGKK